MRRHVLAAASLLALAVPAAGAAAAELASHRAFYKVTLDRGSTGITGATGIAASALERTCDGWIISQRMEADISIGEGQTLRMDTRFAGWESLNQNNYRFAVRSSFGANQDTFKGSAEGGSAAGKGSVTYTAPTSGTLPLPHDVLFPVGHLRRLIDAAAGGKRLVSATVFEGSDDAGPRLATTFIRPAPPADAAMAGVLGDHAGVPAWMMRTAYFPPEGAGSVPDFEVEAGQLANGIVTDIKLDYGEFSVLLSLESLEPLPPPSC